MDLLDLSYEEKQRLALLVACPRCGARIGERCYRGFRYKRDAHAPRVLAAAEHATPNPCQECGSTDPRGCSHDLRLTAKL